MLPFGRECYSFTPHFVSLDTQEEKKVAKLDGLFGCSIHATMIGAKLDFRGIRLSQREYNLPIYLQRKNHLRASVLIAQNRKEHCQAVPSVGYVGVYRKPLDSQRTKELNGKKESHNGHNVRGSLQVYQRDCIRNWIESWALQCSLLFPWAIA